MDFMKTFVAGSRYLIVLKKNLLIFQIWILIILEKVMTMVEQNDYENVVLPETVATKTGILSFFI